jgi:hypothetical protein
MKIDIDKRQANNNDNIKKWREWSNSINAIVSQFPSIVENLTERLDIAEMTIKALEEKIKHMNSGDNKWVKLQQDTIEISSSKEAIYTKSCGIFSSVDSSMQNTIYVYSEKSINGLYVNNTKLYASTIGEWAQPFTTFAGSDAGTMFQIKTDNMTKIGENIKLYFSTDSSIKFNDYNSDNNDIARLIIKVDYAPVRVNARPYINDNSKLSKVLQTNIVKLSDKLKDIKTVEKVHVPVGRYSAGNTPSRTAEGIRTEGTRTTRR